MNNLNFGENLVSLRRKKGITQEQLADFIGVTKASVSKMFLLFYIYIRMI